MLLRRGIVSLCSFPLLRRIGVICKSKSFLLYSWQPPASCTYFTDDDEAPASCTYFTDDDEAQFLHSINSPSTSFEEAQFLKSVQNADTVDAFRNIYNEMLRSEPLPPAKDFTLLFGSAIEMRYYFPVISFIRDFHSSVSVERDLNIMNVLITCFCQLKYTDLGFSTLGSMFKIGLEPDAVTFTTLINGLCGEGKVDQAIELLQNMEEMEYQPHSDICEVISSRFDKIGTTAATRVHRKIVYALCKDGSEPEALKLCLEMSKKGIEPTLATYNCLLEGLCNSGRWHEASTLLIYMLQKTRIVPDWDTFNILAHALSQEGMVSGVKIIISLMIRTGLEPDEITFTALIYGYCLQNQINDAEEARDLMGDIGCLPDVVSCNSLIYGFCKTNNIIWAEYLIDQMLCSEVVLPDMVTWNTFMHECFKAGDPRAERVMSSRSLYRNGRESNLHTCNILLDGLFKCGLYDDAEGWFEFFGKIKLELNSVGYNIMLHGMCRAGKLNDARELFDRLPGKGLKRDVYSYAIIIKALCNAGLLAEAENLRIDMEQNAASLME